jgi:hypothetical protein
MQKDKLLQVIPSIKELQTFFEKLLVDTDYEGVSWTASAINSLSKKNYFSSLEKEEFKNLFHSLPSSSSILKIAEAAELDGLEFFNENLQDNLHNQAIIQHAISELAYAWENVRGKVEDMRGEIDWDLSAEEIIEQIEYECSSEFIHGQTREELLDTIKSNGGLQNVAILKEEGSYVLSKEDTSGYIELQIHKLNLNEQWIEHYGKSNNKAYMWNKFEKLCGEERAQMIASEINDSIVKQDLD